MTKPYLIAALFLLCHLPSSATESGQRLGTGWEYHQGSLGSTWEIWRGEAASDNVTWTPVTLPHCFNARDAVDPEVRYYQGPGWYRTRLKLENPFPNGRTLLHFDGAGQSSQVFIGTGKIGEHLGGYDEWTVDITEVIAKLDPNDIPLAVRCDNSRDAESIPSDLSDFNRYGGLYRHVTLHCVPAVSLERVHIIPALTPDGGASIRVRSRLLNPGALRDELELAVEISDPAGKVIHQTSKTLAPWDGDKELDLSEIAKPELWSPKSPSLYRCAVTLKSKHGEHRVTERFGLRSVEWVKHGPFKLNGERLLLRGTHYHEDHAGVAAAVPDEVVRQTLQAIKDMPHFFHAEYGGDSHAGRHAEDPEIFLKAVATGKGTTEVGKAYKATGGNARASKDGDWSESYMVNLFDWHLKEQEQMPDLTGAAQWIFKDFSTPLRPENPVPRVNQKGVIARDGTLKESYYVFQSYGSEKPMIHIYGHTWPIRWGKPGEAKMVKFGLTGDGKLIDNLGTAGGSRIVQLANGRARISLDLTGATVVASISSDGIETGFTTIKGFDVAAIERDRILKAAEAALARPPISITRHRAKLSEGGPNDFYSNGDYWWPDPAKPDGLPYIQRDGQTNPDNFNQHRMAIRDLRDAVAALAAAYQITRDDRHAAKAADLLRVFFLDPATRMNPHLNYAQAIPGRTPGRGIGIIDTLHLIEIPVAIDAMSGSRAFPPEVAAGLKEWFAAYLDWMITSKNGREEAVAKNNHAVAYWLQAAVFARFAGDEKRLAECRRQFLEVFIPEQMAADGSFPAELARTKPYAYSIFQLDNMVTLCHVLAGEEDDLWNFELPDGRGIRKASAFLFPFLADKSKWPRKPDVQAWEGWPARQPALIFSGLAFGEPSYLDLWRKLPPDPVDPEVQRNIAITQPLLWLK